MDCYKNKYQVGIRLGIVMIMSVFQLLIMVLFHGALYAQVERIQQVEIPMSISENHFNLLPAEELGLVLFRKKTTDELTDIIDYELLYHDKDFNLVWNTEFEAEYLFELTHAIYEDGVIYLLFEGLVNLKKHLFVNRFHLLEKKFETIPIESFFPEIVTYFDVFHHTMIIGGMARSKPSIVFYHVETKRPVVLQGIYNKKSSILDVNIDPENQVFTVLTNYKNVKGLNSINIRSFDESGNPIENNRIEPIGDMHFSNAKAAIINNNMRIVAGTYSKRKMPYEEGVFVTTIKFDESQETKYYAFTDIAVLMDSLKIINGDSAIQNLKNAKGILNYEWNITLTKDLGSSNVVVIESCRKTKSISASGQGMEGYTYYTAYILGFNDQMEMVWLNDFELSDLTSKNWRSWIQIKPAIENNYLWCFSNNRLNEKLIARSNSIENQHYVPLLYVETPEGVPINFENENSVFSYWFGEFYVFAGVKNYGSGDNRKYVYFIEKIKY